MKLELSLKRGFDLVASLLGLIFLSPVFAIVALAIKLESPRAPLFFNDLVMGRGQRQFRMLKFRTMVPHAIDYETRLVSPEIGGSHPLVTRVGGLLRRTKLDELPQLLNVLLGHMSVVGPRPMDPHRFARANQFLRQRLVMRPGMTGWAQVNGNINLSWEARMEMDIWYIANWSWLLDMKIMLATVPEVVFGECVKETAYGRLTDHNYEIKWPGQALIISRHALGSAKEAQDSCAELDRKEGPHA